jgi:hypothetical protein
VKKFANSSPSVVVVDLAVNDEVHLKIPQGAGVELQAPAYKVFYTRPLANARGSVRRPTQNRDRKGAAAERTDSGGHSPNSPAAEGLVDLTHPGGVRLAALLRQ